MFSVAIIFSACILEVPGLHLGFTDRGFSGFPRSVEVRANVGIMPGLCQESLS
jgi:hypothetical protein